MLDANILYVICPENGEEDPDFTYDFDEATRRVKEYRAKGFTEAHALCIDLDTDVPVAISRIPLVFSTVNDDDTIRYFDVWEGEDYDT